MSNSLQVKSIVFLNITDLSEVQLRMSSNSWTWECPHTKDGADHVPFIFLSSVVTHYLFKNLDGFIRVMSDFKVHNFGDPRKRAIQNWYPFLRVKSAKSKNTSLKQGRTYYIVLFLHFHKS